MIVGLIRKIAKSQDTEYAQKFLELVQDILSTVNESCEDLSVEESRLVQMSFGLLTDMIDN